jgi:hypothetical protein
MSVNFSISIFSETTGKVNVEPNLARNVHWMVLYKVYAFPFNQKFTPEP